jgi:HCOMODA/2-hydroxy-3-carboxy-muconic semialdehyde decarboxylase
VTANRILAKQGIVDSFGHVSVRHPDNPQRYFLSRARAPERVEIGDIMEFTLESEPVDARGRNPYVERFIHGAAYEARPDVMAVIHNHSPGVIPFGVTGRKMGRSLRNESHWIRVPDGPRGGKGRTALMRGHGCVVAGPYLRATVYTAVYLELNAKLQMQAESMSKKVRFLTKGEQQKVVETTTPTNVNRAWENWCRAAERPYME